jgi:hypothetical protein
MLTARQIGDVGEIVSVGSSRRLAIPAPWEPASRFGEIGWSARIVTAVTWPATCVGSVKALSFVASDGTTRVVSCSRPIVWRAGMSATATTISRVGSAVMGSSPPWLLR